MEIQIRLTARFFVACIVVAVLLGALCAVAIPNVGRMIAHEEAQARTLELYRIQTAVTDMLYDSICGQVEPIGPISDMGKVRTRDICPLVLTDYLDGFTPDTGCSYSFAADGTVIQIAPR